MRDLNFVANIVDGFMLAASTPKASGRAINLGSGNEIRIGELAQLIARLAHLTIRIEGDKVRVRPKGSEVERLLADNQLAPELLGWKPCINLEDGLQRTIKWIQEHPERYRPDDYVL